MDGSPAVPAPAADDDIIQKQEKGRNGDEVQHVSELNLATAEGNQIPAHAGPLQRPTEEIDQPADEPDIRDGRGGLEGLSPEDDRDGGEEDAEDVCHRGAVR